MDDEEDLSCYLNGCYCNCDEAAREARAYGLLVRCGGGLPCACSFLPDDVTAIASSAEPELHDPLAASAPVIPPLSSPQLSYSRSISSAPDTLLSVSDQYETKHCQPSHSTLLLSGNPDSHPHLPLPLLDNPFEDNTSPVALLPSSEHSVLPGAFADSTVDEHHPPFPTAAFNTAPVPDPHTVQPRIAHGVPPKRPRHCKSTAQRQTAATSVPTPRYTRCGCGGEAAAAGRGGCTCGASCNCVKPEIEMAGMAIVELAARGAAGAVPPAVDPPRSERCGCGAGVAGTKRRSCCRGGASAKSVAGGAGGAGEAAATARVGVLAKLRAAEGKQRPFVCDQCNATFVFKQNRDRHVIEVHQGHRPFVCSHEGCKAAFKNSSGLKQHESTVHLKERPFRCEHCSATFGQRNHLTQHVSAVHEGRRPFRCGSCDAAFSNRGNLNQHLRRRRHVAKDVS